MITRAEFAQQLSVAIEAHKTYLPVETTVCSGCDACLPADNVVVVITYRTPRALQDGSPATPSTNRHAAALTIAGALVLVEPAAYTAAELAPMLLAHMAPCAPDEYPPLLRIPGMEHRIEPVIP